MAKVSSLTIKEALTRLKKGLLSAEELCTKCSHRIKKTRWLNMYVTEVPEDTMLAQANESQKLFDKGKSRPLEAIPIGFKDNFCTKGIPTTCASQMLLNYVPPYNATMVNKCLDSGAVLTGKLNLDEFAMGLIGHTFLSMKKIKKEIPQCWILAMSSSSNSCHGPVKNPWNLAIPQSHLTNTVVNKGNSEETSSESDQDDLSNSDYIIAGGSSGGSAAAIAAGACLAAFGSDTGGSVRIPANFCGVVGFKPTYGLLSRHGLIPLVNSMDCPGILASTVEDCAIVLNAVAGHDVYDSTTVNESHAPFNVDPSLDLSGLHVGIPKEFCVSSLSEEVLSIWRDMADSLENAGAQVSQVSLPHVQYSLPCYSVLCFCEVASNFARYDGIEFGLRKGSEESTEELYAASRHLGFNDTVRGRILSGNYFLLESNYEKYFINAQRVRRLISNDLKKVYQSGVDLLLSPMNTSEAPKLSWYGSDDHNRRREESDIFAVIANLTGVPAITVPVRLSQSGLPLSLQLIGQTFGESKLLSVAHWLQKTADCPRLNLDFLDDEQERRTL